MSESSDQPCAICGKPATERYRPFCSKRCADIDLHKWLSGRYAIPAEEDEERDVSDDGEAPDGAGQPGRG
jgi:endogenous inhibitor of DNA gyrase (YacG/DUF329 family)